MADYFNKKDSYEKKSCTKEVKKKSVKEKIKYWKEKSKKLLEKRSGKFEELIHLGTNVIKFYNNKLEEAPIYYVLSIFCYEYRFKNLDLKMNKFGEKIFGKYGDSKFIKNFVPNYLFKNYITKTKTKIPLVRNLKKKLIMIY